MVVVLDGEPAGPVAMQTWDWHEELASCFHVLSIEHPDGHVVRTLTEYGIVGKLGVSGRGLGLLLNILHHDGDGDGIGVPVHVIARRVLDEAQHVNHALQLVASARPSASSALTLVADEDGERAAITAEVFPGGPRYVLPDRDGVLLHTNHFVGAGGAARRPRARCIAPGLLPAARPPAARGPRHEQRGGGAGAMSSRLGGGGAICCRPDPDAVLGERWATLATIQLDVAGAGLVIRRGGPTEPVVYATTAEPALPVRA